MIRQDIIGTQECIGRSEAVLEMQDLGVPPLTNLQESAIDLKRRGFNVFPIPYASKQPFAGTSLKRLYSSSLHLCGDGIDKCRHGQSLGNFASLFEGRKNIAVMCGKTSGNLVDIDCDTQSAYELMGKELDARGLPYWTFNSHNGRGGYLLRILEGEAANVVAGKSKFNDVELWGNSHYIVIPGSVHPTGEFYSWRGDSNPRYCFPNSYQTLPAVSVGELTSWLGLTLLKDDQFQRKPFEMFGLPAEYAVLSRRNREALAQGANDGERNIRLTALAYDLAGCALERDDIEDDFLIAAARCTPAYSAGNALAILKHAYSKPRTRARKDSHLGDPTAKTQQLYAFAKSFDWKRKFKRKARMRKLFFMMCIVRSTMEGDVFRASVREMAEMANRKYQFASVCMRDLIGAKLIRLAVPGNKSNSGANVYPSVKKSYFLQSLTAILHLAILMSTIRHNKKSQTQMRGRMFLEN